ncbi:MAG: dTMP kinase [Dehalococcoidia bacterium]|nr:dTMP kinase [Dehalococcoidia bacterium]
MSVLITFEGGDGSGKSTQADLLRRRLSEDGFTVLLVREPGGTLLGESIRKLVKNQPKSERLKGSRKSRRLKRSMRESLSPISELFLFLAARSQLVRSVIKPALSRPGAVVICDRYMDSTVAYQGYGSRLSVGMVRSANEVAVEGVIPDLTFLLDLPPAIAERRAGAQTRLEGAADAGEPRLEPEGTARFEEETAAFRMRVYDGYLKMAAGEPQRWRRIDATKPEQDIADEVRRLAEEVLVGLAPTASTTGDDEDMEGCGQPSLF